MMWWQICSLLKAWTTIFFTAMQKIWSALVPIKICVLGWWVIQDKIPARVNLWQIGVISYIYQQCCVLCFDNLETKVHFLFACLKAFEVWNSMLEWLV